MPQSKLPHKDRTTLRDAIADTPQFSTVRTRQIFIRDALGGYPTSEDILKALRRYVDWEGGSVIVADDILSLLDGHELAPGIAALALLAQAVEAVAGPSVREQISDLRHRMGWNTVDEPAAPAADWRDSRPRVQVIRERIIGENTLRPLYYLRRALVAADAVVRIDLGSRGSATGFLVAPNLMMTNNHVIADEAQAQSARVCFYDESLDAQDLDQARRLPVIARPAAAAEGKALLHTNVDLDFTLVRLENCPPLARYLPIRPALVEQDQRVVIIQHPGGYPKQISLQNNLVAAADSTIVQYYTSTKPGSSGSPVFDDNFSVIAIHHSSVHNPDWDGGGGRLRLPDPKQIEDLQYRNQGTSMIAVLEDLKKSHPDLVKEMTIVD